MTVLAATKWNTNAEMIVDIVELGYIKPTDSVIDLTFGRGKWWTEYQHPGQFAACLTEPEVPPLLVYENDWVEWFIADVDFRALRPAIDELFDVVVFDPPYVSTGGRETSTIPDFNDRYGLKDAASTPELLQKDNEQGLREAWRICKPGGLVIVKCAPYISSGVRKEGDWWARDAALKIGFKVHDMLIHVGDVRAQPKDGKCRRCGSQVKCPRCATVFSAPLTGGGALPVHHPDEPNPTSYQICSGTGTTPDPCPKCAGSGRIPRKVKHARNNYSVAFVFRKPKPRKKATT